jgi:hypothetical protein
VTRGLVSALTVLLTLGVAACGSFEITVEHDPVGATPAPPEVEQIAFARGATSARVSGTAWAGVQPRYEFEARRGQTLRIQVTSSSDAVNYGLTDPDGQPLKRVTQPARRGEFQLPASGDYVISLAAVERAAYTVVVEIE